MKSGRSKASFNKVSLGFFLTLLVATQVQARPRPDAAADYADKLVAVTNATS